MCYSRCMILLSSCYFRQLYCLNNKLLKHGMQISVQYYIERQCLLKCTRRILTHACKFIEILFSSSCPRGRLKCCAVLWFRARKCWPNMGAGLIWDRGNEWTSTFRSIPRECHDIHKHIVLPNSVTFGVVCIEDGCDEGRAIREEVQELISAGLDSKLISLLEDHFSSTHPEQMVC